MAMSMGKEYLHAGIGVLKALARTESALRRVARIGVFTWLNFWLSWEVEMYLLLWLDKGEISFESTADLRLYEIGFVTDVGVDMMLTTGKGSDDSNS
jgi:hypothetical protein